MKVFSKTTRFVIVLLSTGGLVTSALWAADKKNATYTIDYQQSQIKFLAKSRFSDAKGIFHQWSFTGTVMSRDRATGMVKIEMSSIDTGNKKRDTHLKSADFLDIERFPLATYEIMKVNNKENTVTLKGKLTLKGVTRKETLIFTIEPDNKNLILKGKHVINRAHYGIKSDSALNPIAENIEIDLQIVLVPKK